MSANKVNIYEKLVLIQNELKAKKSRFNKFSNFNYRSLEDIFEGVKPLLAKHKATLTINNELIELNGVIFRKATAYLRDLDSDACIETSTYAQECLERKGMSPEQCSGSVQSYVSKYCLNLLFLLDDSKDPDEGEVEESKKPSSKPPKKEVKSNKVSVIVDNMRLMLNPKDGIPINNEGIHDLYFSLDRPEQEELWKSFRVKEKEAIRAAIHAHKEVIGKDVGKEHIENIKKVLE